jgi:hypothetical protein
MGLPRPPGSPIALPATSGWHTLPVATTLVRALIRAGCNNALLRPRRSAMTSRNAGLHSGEPPIADKDEVPGSSPGRPTTILPAQRADAARPVVLTACLGRTGAARPPQSRAQGPPGAATRGPGRSQRAPIVVATGSAQVMVGLMPASMALTTCGAIAQMGCTARGRCSSTDGRSWRSTGVSLAGQAVDPGPLPERLP